MLDSRQIVLIVVFTLLQLSIPAFFIGRRIACGELRVRFSLRALFALTTVVAMSFGIVQLTMPWPFKFVMIYGLLVCACGLATSRLPPPARPMDRGDD